LFLDRVEFSPRGQVFIFDPSGELVAESIAPETFGKLSPLNTQNNENLVTKEITQQVRNLGNIQQTIQLRFKVAGQNTLPKSIWLKLASGDRDARSRLHGRNSPKSKANMAVIWNSFIDCHCHKQLVDRFCALVNPPYQIVLFKKCRF
jgi:hypothetical protein